MGSTRLPGKVLLPIGDHPLLGHIVRRLTRLQNHAQIVIATSTALGDDAVAAYCRQADVSCFRGDELDVLGRYYQCAIHYGFEHVARLTGDNPFVDVEELDRLIDVHLRSGVDYTSSIAYLPIGTGAEIFTFSALSKCHSYGQMAHHREHVNEYILENKYLFSTKNLRIPADKQRPDVRLTVDTPDDYRKVCRIIEVLADDFVQTTDAIAIADRFGMTTDITIPQEAGPV
jgi:spore coat polysaccharide biosynthesis protein SpsF